MSLAASRNSKRQNPDDSLRELIRVAKIKHAKKKKRRSYLKAQESSGENKGHASTG
jgi:hypothetical protein